MSLATSLIPLRQPNWKRCALSLSRQGGIQQLREPNFTQFWPPPPRVDKHTIFGLWTFYWPNSSPPLLVHVVNERHLITHNFLYQTARTRVDCEDKDQIGKAPFWVVLGTYFA